MKRKRAKRVAAAAPGQRVTRAALSRLLGISRSAVTQAVKAGRLTVENGTIDVTHAIEVFAGSETADDAADGGANAEHSEAMRTLRRQFLTARVAEVETRAADTAFDLAVKRGRYMENDAHFAVLAAYAALVKKRFWSWQATLPPHLAQREPLDIAEALERETRAALENASTALPDDARRLCAWLLDNAPDLETLPPAPPAIEQPKRKAPHEKPRH